MVSLLSLVENINKSFNNQIINNRQTINNLFNQIKVLFNTIRPQSIFYSIAKDILEESNNTITLVNNQFISIKKVLNNINNISTTKKTDYEIEKKLIEDNKIYVIEEEEKQLNSDLLLELIENKEENTMTTPMTTPMTKPMTIPYTTPLSIITTAETANIDYTIYIIVAIVVILIIFWLIKK